MEGPTEQAHYDEYTTLLGGNEADESRTRDGARVLSSRTVWVGLTVGLVAAVGLYTSVAESRAELITPDTCYEYHLMGSRKLGWLSYAGGDYDQDDTGKVKDCTKKGYEPIKTYEGCVVAAYQLGLDYPKNVSQSWDTDCNDRPVGCFVSYVTSDFNPVNSRRGTPLAARHLRPKHVSRGSNEWNTGDDYPGQVYFNPCKGNPDADGTSIGITEERYRHMLCQGKQESDLTKCAHPAKPKCGWFGC